MKNAHKMKNIQNRILGLLTILLIIVVSCKEDDLPKASFDLDVVTKLAATAVHERVTLSWEAPAAQTNTPSGYRVGWSPDGQVVDLASSVNVYDIVGLETGKKYTFFVQAKFGDKNFSGKTEITATPPDQLNFNVFAGSGFAIATWDTPDRSDITGYEMTWDPDGATPVVLASEDTVYQVTGLNNGTEYTFNLTVVYGDVKSSTAATGQTTPGAVTGFTFDEAPKSGEAIQFAFNPAFVPQSTATSWIWDFGDGNSSTNSSTMQAPTHTFSSPGKYTVGLTIMDDQGLTFNVSQEVSVWGEKWSYDIGSVIKPQIPAIGDDGTIYIGSENNTDFHAINANGTLKWTYTGLGDNVYSSAAIGSDGTVYVGAKDSYLHAINPADGSEKWKFRMSGDPIGASPAIAADGTIYIGTDGDNMYAINPDGTEKWVFSTSGSNVRSTPAIAADGTVYIASDDDNLYALNPANGEEKWSFSVGGDVEGCVSVDTEGTIYVSVDQGTASGAVFAVNPDGTEKWSASVAGRILSSPAIANGRVYVGTKDINQLLSFDASNGSQQWAFTADHIILSSPSVDTNGVIYFGSFDDHIYAINPDGTEKYKVNTGENVWSSATIGSDGTVYIGGYDGKLYAFEFFADAPSSDAWPMFGKNAKHTGR